MSDQLGERYLIPIDDAAKRLGISRRQIYRFIDERLLPQPVKQGRKSYLFNTDLEGYMQKLETHRTR